MPMKVPQGKQVSIVRIEKRQTGDGGGQGRVQKSDHHGKVSQPKPKSSFICLIFLY